MVTGRLAFTNHGPVPYEYVYSSKQRKPWWNEKIETGLCLSARKSSSEVCQKQSCRPACTSAQSYQRLCYLLIGKYNIKTCYKRHFTILACLCSWGDWFEYRFVRFIKDIFCHVEAYMAHRGSPNYWSATKIYYTVNPSKCYVSGSFDC